MHAPSLLRKVVKELSAIWRDLQTRNSFSQNITFTLSGNFIAILITFVFTPIATRIYPPEAYGVFAFFMALSQNLGSVATLQLTRAFVLPRDEGTFKGLFLTAIAFCVACSGLSMLVAIAFGRDLLFYFNAPEVGPYLLFVPLVVFLSSSNDIVRSWAIRVKAFARGSYAKVGATIGSRITGVAVGLGTSGSPVGMVAGEIVHYVADTASLLTSRIGKMLLAIRTFKVNDVLRTLRQFRSYPTYILPSHFAAGVATQLPIYFLMAYFDSDMVGHYAIANRMLSIPALMLTTSLAPVFLQRVSEQYHQGQEQIPSLVGRLVRWLLVLTLIPFLILINFSDSFFALFLGSQWRTAGLLAMLLAWYYPLYIVASSLAPLFRVFGKERLIFVFSMIQVVVVALGFWIGGRTQDFFFTLALYSIISVFLNGTQTYILLKISGYRAYGKLFLILVGYLTIALAISLLKTGFHL